MRELLEQALDALIVLLDEWTPASQWMPIETAPKDSLYEDGENRYGRRILVWGNGYDEPMRARWWFRIDSNRQNFISDAGFAVFPTHWMPLPAAPDHLRDVTEKAAPVPDGWVMAPREPTQVPLVEGGYAELATRMRGRADFIRDQGGIKSAELMEQGADAITFLAAPPVAPAHVPLTDEQFASEWHRRTGRIMGTDRDLLLQAKYVTEAAHGITGASK